MGRFAIVAVAMAAVVLGACGDGNVFSLKVGDCFENPGTGVEVSNVTTTDCGEPHGVEVYGLFDLPDGDFPGAAVVEDAAIEGCLSRFEPYVGRDFDSSALDISWLYPTPDSWDQGDQEIVCILRDFGGDPLTGSMKDSGV
ncbi:MAG: septum formation family protein [Chloroflexi bacterium]|nr:septum formation family protein [Chloroflexota bacterium]MDA1145622.1 septum formation family protein [Chloroflexota bacterium]